MRYEAIANLKAGEFRRLTGVHRETFSLMVSLLKNSSNNRKDNQKHRGGRRPKLTLPDQLLMTLEYLREYRTQFHIASHYGVSESVCNRTIRRVEDVLMQSREFTLPGRKSLLKSDISYDVVIIDATETPIERPKKSKNIFIQERKSVTR